MLSGLQIVTVCKVALVHGYFRKLNYINQGLKEIVTELFKLSA